MTTGVEKDWLREGGKEDNVRVRLSSIRVRQLGKIAIFLEKLGQRSACACSCAFSGDSLQGSNVVGCVYRDAFFL
jgi:hypothetical protein